ncbi:PhnB protein [Pullulanibacillus pueri]|uniref:VOC family protein n=1 Tax=Pullulanibacillus pueri TaxID=1437324 RepID=A0A8J3ENT1_9BACL|nr:VOC family protein [Pullulanibacillus pueri]MBM7684208.1 PhnB protein [Pullulanibacillus pueri]GGH88965.1 VOC family protein [Pullulanibacillus pueri]
MVKLSPYIFSRDARKQADFYAKALDGEITLVKTFDEMPNVKEDLKGKVMHLVLKVGDQQFLMADSSSEMSGPIDLVLEFPHESEAQAVFDKLSEGGKVIMPFEKMFWGTSFGRLEDPFGVRWQIATEA